MRIQRATAAVALTAATAIALAGCGSDSDNAPHTGTDDHAAITPLSPQEIDADQTAITAMQTILSWQPAVDDSKGDVLVRAKPWLGGDLLAAAEEGKSVSLRPDRDWQQWAADKDALTANCVRADTTPAAPAGMRTVVIDVTCRQTVLHASGQSTRLTPETWRTTVTRTDDGWRMTDYRFQK
uniref:Putative membrane protein n=1 Tax=Rhodococcus hoagii TaxID=43767 RepID=A0A1Z1UYM8_RHOHA|nr:putative membrane protein [Prescottella equi]